MKIQQIREHRDALEKDLIVEIRRLVEAFRKKTGIAPESIYVDMIDCRTIASAAPFYVVGRVKAHISL